MTSDEFRKYLFDVVEAVKFDSGRPYDDITDSALTLAAFAMSMLPPAEREASLTAIESLGTLRRAVERFPCAPSEAPHGPLH